MEAGKEPVSSAAGKLVKLLPSSVGNTAGKLAVGISPERFAAVIFVNGPPSPAYITLELIVPVSSAAGILVRLVALFAGKGSGKLAAGISPTSSEAGRSNNPLPSPEVMLVHLVINFRHMRVIVLSLVN